jgi:DNA-binding PadR family transcriptional regulator
MTVSAHRPGSLLPLSPAAFHILLALADGEQHGFTILLEVEEMTGGAVHMGPGTLHGSIKRMLAAGLIEESDDRPDPAIDDQRRRSHRQTGLGRKVLREETERMAGLTALARRKQVLVGIGSETHLAPTGPG